MRKISLIAPVLLCAGLLGAPLSAFAQSVQAKWANSTISKCLYPNDQPTVGAVVQACHTAVAAAAREAGSDEHNAPKKNVYWSQAHDAATMAAIAQSQMDQNTLTPAVCQFVLSARHAYNQINPKPGPNSPLQQSQTITLAIPDCLALMTRETNN